MKQRTAARVAWTLVGVFVVVGTAAQTAVIRLEGLRASLDDLLFLPAFAAFSVVGALIVSRQSRNTVGWIFLLVAMTAVAAFGSGTVAQAALEGEGPRTWVVWTAWVSTWTWVVFFTPMVIFLPLLFPDGRVPTPRWRPYAWGAGLVMTVAVAGFALDPGPLSGFRRYGIENPVGVPLFDGVGDFLEGGGFAIPLAMAVVSAVSLVLRFRRATSDVRNQIKWFVFAFAVLAGWLAITGGLSSFGVSLPPLLDSILSALIFASLPVAAGIGILRYRLFDINVVINRALVYAVLAAIITGVYVAVVVGIGALIGSRGNVFLSIVATALIALAFQPLRERVRHLANRLVYGKRATPYEVLSGFADRMAGGYELEDVLPRLAEMIGAGTGARRVRIWVRVGGELRSAGEWPPGGEPDVVAIADGRLPELGAADRTIPVRHREELLGAITVEMPPNESLTPANEQLLDDIASQAGLMLRNVVLVEELRASRQRIVAAQDEERRKLERNIHDGAQQQLVALAVRLKLAETVAKKEAPKVADLIAGIRSEATDAMENLRDLARGIYPPLLADQGLASALAAQARKVPFPVQVEPNGISRYAQDVEAAVYFCVLEALQNAAKYAEASRAVVRLRADDGHIVFEVSDDGRGFDVRTTAHGSGLTNMRDRVEALGGAVTVDSSPTRGTTILGRIPVGTEGSRR